MLRLSLLLSLIFAIGFAVAITVALILSQRAIERRIDTSLAALAGAAVLEDARGDSPTMILRSPSDLGGLPGPFGRAVVRGGGTVDLRDDFLRSEQWRVLVARDSQNAPVMVAVPLDRSTQAQELMAGILWATAAVVIALTLALGVGTGLLAQRRLARINDTLGELAKGDLSARTGHARSRDDLDDIARNLDHSAGELERLVAQTRNLSASIAHDLRTPLARLRAQLEMLPKGEGRSDALEEINRLTGIFDTIMRVARIEATQGREGFETVHLGDLASDMAETFGPVVEDAGKTLLLTLERPGTVHADRQMLVQALANLIQNAIVHGGDQITVLAKGVTLGVEDNGPGVDPAQYSEIVKPMVRLDESRTTEGSGLGLALVRAVADRHGATLELSPKQPQGFCAVLNLANL